eukprot:TRINITY_DN9509_c0_g1_i1.p1 TRINITY_DN9509_c0_g1~~TRINITY_DN9509_c0_g1_i1.p1  ORF type:complete len:535 (+),score=145.46 TRINITY_DN9509_c0_g1_i1:93-1607(+)
MPSLQDLIGTPYFEACAADASRSPTGGRALAAQAWELSPDGDCTFSPTSDAPSPRCRRGNVQGPPLVPPGARPLLGGAAVSASRSPERGGGVDGSGAAPRPPLLSPQRRRGVSPPGQSWATPEEGRPRGPRQSDVRVSCAPPPAPEAPSPQVPGAAQRPPPAAARSAPPVGCGPRQRAQMARDAPPLLTPRSRSTSRRGLSGSHRAARAPAQPRERCRSLSPSMRRNLPYGHGGGPPPRDRLQRSRSAGAPQREPTWGGRSPRTAGRSPSTDVYPRRGSPSPAASRRPTEQSSRPPPQPAAVHLRLYDSAAQLRERKALAASAAQQRRQADEEELRAQSRAAPVGGERLRELLHHLGSTRRRESDVEALRRLRDEAEMKDCTFRPRILASVPQACGGGAGPRRRAPRRAEKPLMLGPSEIEAHAARLHAESARRDSWRRQALQEREKNEMRQLEAEKRKANPRYAARCQLQAEQRRNPESAASGPAATAAAAAAWCAVRMPPAL